MHPGRIIHRHYEALDEVSRTMPQVLRVLQSIYVRARAQCPNVVGGTYHTRVGYDGMPAHSTLFIALARYHAHGIPKTGQSAQRYARRNVAARRHNEVARTARLHKGIGDFGADFRH